MMPFGASISCAIWEKFATSLHLIIQSKSRNPSILHYLDDFLFAGPVNSNFCQFTLDFFKEICNHIGVPIALDKTTVLNTTIFFLGIDFDTIHASCGSPKTNYTHWDKLFDSCRMPKKSSLSHCNWSAYSTLHAKRWRPAEPFVGV